MDRKKRAAVRWISRLTKSFARAWGKRREARRQCGALPCPDCPHKHGGFKEAVLFCYLMAALTGLLVLAVYILLGRSDSSLKLVAAMSLWRMGRKIMRHLTK